VAARVRKRERVAVEVRGREGTARVYFERVPQCSSRHTNHGDFQVILSMEMISIAHGGLILYAVTLRCLFKL
jgi:hypothetical protein